jgi:cytochrome c oxidase subunit 4
MRETTDPRRIYFGICAVLLALTFLTWRAALVDLGRWNLVVAMSIAAAKASLVAYFFMHLRESDRRPRLALLAGLFWLGLLLVLTLSDYLTRT